MSYPEERYDGQGEVSASLRNADTPAELTYPNGVRFSYLSRGQDTQGLFGLYRVDFSPAVTGPGPHFHRTLTESFFILSGTVRVHDGAAWVDAHPGDYLHVPIGGVHGFRNESGEEASMLLHFAPGAPREGYFEGLARLADGEDWDEDTFTAFMREHDNHWVV